MQDEFDKLLVDRIKEVFENYEDNTASAGWDKLQKKLSGKKERKLPVLWWWSSAAAILFLALTYGYYTSHRQVIYLTAKPRPTDVQQSQSAENPSLSSMDVDAANPAFSGPAEVQTAKITAEPASSPLDLIYYTSRNKSRESETLIADKQASIIADSTEDIMQLASVQSTPAGDIEPLNTEQPVAASEPEKRLRSLTELPDDKKENPRTRRNGLTVGVFAGSYINYSKGSESAVNSGFGIVSELGLSKKLKLSTGIALARNSLKYDVQIPQKAAATFAKASVVHDAPSMLIGPAVATSYSLHNYDAFLLGLDIPLNLRYNVFENANSLYLSAGISSNFFIDESYKYSYSISNSRSINPESEKMESSAQSFDFARMLNLSLGFEHSLGRQNKISLEPFVKYPLGGLGTQNLRFGSAGMNIKMSLNTRKPQR